MGNSQRKGAEKKDKEEQRKDRQEEESDEGDSEVEAAAYLDLKIEHTLEKGSTTKLDMHPPWNLKLADFKEDVRALIHTNRRIEIYRDNRNDPLGPEHLSLRDLNIDNGTPLSVKEFDN